MIVSLSYAYTVRYAAQRRNTDEIKDCNSASAPVHTLSISSHLDSWLYNVETKSVNALQRFESGVPFLLEAARFKLLNLIFRSI